MSRLSNLLFDRRRTTIRPGPLTDNEEVGCVDTVDPLLTGWLVDRTGGGGEVAIGVFVADVHVGDFPVNVARADISELGHSGPAGFSVDWREHLRRDRAKLTKLAGMLEGQTDKTASLRVASVKTGRTIMQMGSAETRSVGLEDVISVRDEHKRVQLRFFPDYTPTNPYQPNLYSAFDDEFAIAPGTIDQAIETVERGARTIFHVHWPDALFGGCVTRDDYARRADTTLTKLRYFRSLGGIVVWTAHNVYPHDNPLRDFWIEFHADLARVANLIHLHSKSALALLRESYPIDEAKCVVRAHGNYVGAYPNTIGREAARERLGLSPTSTVFGFVGQLRTYKGLDSLLSSFRRLASEKGDVELVIAGKSMPPLKPTDWSHVGGGASRISVHEGFVKDEDLQLYLNAADVVVLPYRHILTSGSLLLATSFGKPVIIPDLPAFNDFDLDAASLKYGSDDGGLLRAMRAYEALDDEGRKRLSKGAEAFAQGFAWKEISRGLSKDLKALVPRTAPVERVVAGKKVSLLGEVPAPGGIGIAVVGYRNLDEVLEFVRNLPATARERQVKAFVLCNGSTVRRAREFAVEAPGSVVVMSADNLGYAGGNNVLLDLIEEAGCEFAMIANADVRLEKNTLAALVDAAPDGKAAILAPLVLTEDHRISFGGGQLVRSQDSFALNHRLEGADIDAAPERPYEVDFLHGCCLFGRVSSFQTAGHMPEDYFLYYEETDWCLRAAANGVALTVVPSAHAVHLKRSHGPGVPAIHYAYYMVRNTVTFSRRQGWSEKGPVERLRNTFVAGWSGKLAAQSPSYSRIFDRAIQAGLADGAKGITGPVDLGQRLDEVDLPGAMEVSGVVDAVTTTNVSGWVSFRRPGELEWTQDGEIWLIVDGTPVRGARANLARPDVATFLGETRGNQFGFDIPLPTTASDGDAHSVEIRLGPTGMRLPFPDGRRLGSVPLPDHRRGAAPTVPIRARVDNAENGVLSGWVYDSSCPDRTVFVDLLIDEHKFTNVPADAFRADLEQAGFGNGIHGLNVPVPLALTNTASISVSILENGSSNVLARRSVTLPRLANDYDLDFDIQQFFRWAYLHSETPPGAFQRTHKVVEYLRSKKESMASSSTGGGSPLISVIMPVYNREGVVEAAIESVRRQTYANWELVIVDDGSTDRSVEVVKALLERWADPRLRFEVAPQNEGVSAARNRGLRAARGELIAYLDSDNEWYEECLAIIVQAFADEPEFDCVYAGQEIWHFNRLTGQTELRSVRVRPFNRSALERSNFIDLNVFFHRRSALDAFGGFREDMKRLVDWELILRYTRLKPPLFVPVLLNRYHVGRTDNQITRVEDFKRNFIILHGSAEDAGPPALPALGRSGTPPSELPLRVLLTEGSADDARSWLILNADWRKDWSEQVWLGSFSNGLADWELVSGSGNLDQGGYDLLVTSPDVVLQPDWRNVVARARSLGAVRSATGRLERLERGAFSRRVVSDTTPASIVGSIRDWCFSPAMHGVVCGRLGPSLLWVSAQSSRKLIDLIVRTNSPHRGLDFFYRDMSFDGSRGADVYLPDLKASLRT